MEISSVLLSKSCFVTPQMEAKGDLVVLWVWPQIGRVIKGMKNELGCKAKECWERSSLQRTEWRGRSRTLVN